MPSNFSGKNYTGVAQGYDVDVVFCIDATGSMSPILDLVKTHALHFYDDVVREMAKKTKRIDNFRVRVIAFRDYVYDKEAAMLNTDFFTLPAQGPALEAVLRSIKPEGGGDDPEDGLEAVGYAIKSKWSNEPGKKKRNIIVVWSDEGTHPIGFGKSAANYPTKMAKTFSELTEWWNAMDTTSKRMLLYAPEKESWVTIANVWDNVLIFPSEAGKGLDKVTYEEILLAVANSI